MAMSDDDYSELKELRRVAAEAMAAADATRKAGRLAEWDMAVKRAIALEEMATAFAKLAIA